MKTGITVEDMVLHAQSVVERDARAISALKSQLALDFAKAVKTILACPGHVLVTGAGTSSATAGRLAHLLSCCGIPALFIHPGDSQHGLAGAVTKRDVLIALSNGGKTKEVNQLAFIAKERLAKVIAITGAPDSDLTMLSDVAIVLQIPAECDPFHMIATSSSLVIASACNALCETLIIATDYSEEAFWRIHPGGAVGKTIRKKRKARAAAGEG
jgi:D-arabinose 5-phosphate isomerase GutQ